MVFTVYGEHWRKMKRIMTVPFFTSKVIAASAWWRWFVSFTLSISLFLFLNFWIFDLNMSDYHRSMYIL